VWLELNKEGRLRTFLKVGQITEGKREALSEILEDVYTDLLELKMKRWSQKANTGNREEL
jgi:hypothetical protein